MTKKLVLFAAVVLAAFVTFGTSAQARCQPGYDCWARSQGHYAHQQRWSYGQRQMFHPQVRYGQQRHHYQRRYIGTIIVQRGYIPY